MLTDEQKYQELLKEVGEMIKGKNERIMLLEYEVKSLSEKLEAAEKEIAKVKEQNNEQ